jgi:hypothetical protein
MSGSDREWAERPDDERDDAADRAADASGGEPLSVQVDGGRGEPTRVLVLSRTRGELVEVREFRAGCAPLEYTATADELLALFGRAHRERRALSESLYGIRLWLDGLG